MNNFNILKVLPNLNEEQVNGIVDWIKIAGVKTYEDLKYIKEEYLLQSGHITMVEAGKLIEHWEQEIKGNQPSTSGLAQSSLRHTEIKDSTLSSSKLFFVEGNMSVETDKDVSDPPLSEERKQKLCEELKSCLKNSASVLSGRMDGVGAGKKIKISIAPLQLAINEDIEELDKSVFFHRRENVVKPLIGDIQPDELFVRAKDYAEEQAAELCETDDAKQNHILTHGNIVWIVGQAGIGKSTFLKVLVKKILDQKKRLYKADYIFYLNFRDVDYENEITLLEFLTSKSSFLEDMEMSKKELNFVVTMLNESENVILVMDGFDEANLSEPDFKKCSRNDNAKAETFMLNLFHGNILPNSKKVVTSRPLSLSDLKSKNFRPTFIVKILGLSKKAQEQICEDIYANDEPRQVQINEYICSRPDLQSYCYAPAICIWVIQSFKSLEFKSVNSLTAIIVASLEWFVETLTVDGKKFQIKELSHLAFSGFKEHRLQFEQRHIWESGVDLKNNTTFLTVLNVLEGCSKKMYFSHYMWQEFLAAIWLKFFMSFEEFEKFSFEFNESKYEMVLLFLYGLSNESMQGQILNHVAYGFNTTADRNKSKNLLQKIAIKHLRSYGGYLDLRICQWVHEMKDVEFTKKVDAGLTEYIFVLTVLPSDIPALNYVLRARETDRRIRLSTGVRAFRGNCLHQFINELSITLIQQPNIKMESLDLSGNEIDIEGARSLSTCIDKVKKLQVCHCKITSLGIEALADAIKNRSNPMESLDLRFNDIDIEGARFLSTCIHNIKKLNVSYCKITSLGFEALANAIKNRSIPMEYLNVWGNEFGDDGYELLRTCRHNIKSIDE